MRILAFYDEAPYVGGLLSSFGQGCFSPLLAVGWITMVSTRLIIPYEG
jgi:hypothetical protein